MKRIVIWTVAAVLTGMAAFWLLTSPGMTRTAVEPIPEGPADLANGRTMFYAGGCASCHASPNQEDRTRLGGGIALHSPFGTFHAPNISPHPRDGIGSWSLEQFVRAMRDGVSPDGRHYYPSFPYTAYRKMAAADLRDLFAFLHALPVVEGRAPEHDMPFPFSLRRGLGLWKLLFHEEGIFMPDPSRSASWNRGAYLVEGPGHCAECHSPRNRFGAIPEDRRYAGGVSPEGKGWVPNITPHETGLKDWTRSDVEEVLASGFTPLGDSVGSTMAAVVRNTAQLSDADRAAMAEYILSLPPRESRKEAR